MLRIALFVIVATSLPAQALRSGVALGPWSEGRVGLVGYQAWAEGPLFLAGGTVNVPSVPGGLAWGPVSTQLGIVGYAVSQDSWTLHTFAGASSPFEVPVSYQNNEISVQLRSAGTLGFSVERGPWQTGFVAADFDADIAAGESHLGDLAGRARGAFVGAEDVVAFVAVADAEVEALAGLFDLVFFGLQGKVRGWATGVAGGRTFGSSSWSWGASGAFGLAWLDGQLTQYQRLLGHGTLQTTGDRYELSSDPAFFVVLRPEVVWHLTPSVRLGLSRWIPWTSATVSRQSLNASPGGGSRQGKSFRWTESLIANLLVFGWNLELAFES